MRMWSVSLWPHFMILSIVWIGPPAPEQKSTTLIPPAPSSPVPAPRLPVDKPRNTRSSTSTTSSEGACRCNPGKRFVHAKVNMSWTG